jgi:hypothetical protein
MTLAANINLQLASNYTTFFEKLTTVIERFAAVFPQYDEISRLTWDASSSVIKSSLVNVYLDLFEFFTMVARIFTNGRGGMFYSRCFH